MPDGTGSTSSSDSGSEDSGGTSMGKPPMTPSGSDGTGSDFDPGYDDFGDCGGCCGRPYAVGGSVLTAAAVSATNWATPAAVDVAHLLPATRTALAEYWTATALAEHASVGAFHRAALDLLAHGAPVELLLRTQRAALEELEHARACFALAGAYAGRAIGPGPMPLGNSAPIAPSLRDLAVWTVREGCVGETIAAWLAHEIRDHAQDETVREVMAKVAAEETEHAELAWATVRWAVGAGGRSVAEAVAAAFAEARLPVLPSRTIAFPHHGLLSREAVRRTMQRALVEVVRPCATVLLAA